MNPTIHQQTLPPGSRAGELESDYNPLSNSGPGGRYLYVLDGDFGRPAEPQHLQCPWISPFDRRPQGVSHEPLSLFGGIFHPAPGGVDQHGWMIFADII